MLQNTFTVLTVCLFSISTLALGADREDLENFRIEVSGSAWLVNPSGNVQSNGTAINFLSDLGVEQQQPTFFGRLVFKPARKQRLIVEGSPFSFNGLNTIDRSITYQGQTFNVAQTIKTAASLEYVFAGYQYDVISRPGGHLGFSAGGAYLDATATLVSVQLATTATRTEQVGLPLAGTDFRIFPLPRHKWIDIDGDIRGMAFGQYGYYVQGGGNGGLWLGPVALQAGYRIVNTNLHEAGSNPGGITLHMSGPIFALTFHW